MPSMNVFDRTPADDEPESLLSSATQSAELVSRFQAGDQRSLDRLWARYLPRLKKWAHGRLPAPNRDQTSTDDLVQDAFVRSLAHLRRLKPRGPQTLFAYFRTIILNQIRDYARQNARRPTRGALESDAHVDPTPSPLEEILGREALEPYERALETLAEEDQQLVIAFVELRCTDRELAELFEKPSPNAARMARARAVARLVRAMAATSAIPPDMRRAG
jgi:RNA polymerase sigma-70 factor (ECF subfamily)